MAHISTLPAELLSLIALHVQALSSSSEQQKFDFAMSPITSSTPQSSLESCALVNKRFYAHFRPLLYASIQLDCCSVHTQPRSSLYLLERLAALLVREPDIGGWIQDLGVGLTEHDGSSYVTHRRTNWDAWARTDTHTPSILSRLTRLSHFTLWVADSPAPLKWETFSLAFQSAFIHLFSLKTLREVDVHSVLVPPSALFLNRGLTHLTALHLNKTITSGGIPWWEVQVPALAISPPNNTANTSSDLPTLSSLKMDDASPTLLSFLSTTYSPVFQHLQNLDLAASLDMSLDMIPPIQTLLDIARCSLERFTCSLCLFLGPVTPHDPFDFSKLTKLRHLELAYYCTIESHTPAFETGVVDSLRSLSFAFPSSPPSPQPLPSASTPTSTSPSPPPTSPLESLSLFLSWSCFNAPATPPPLLTFFTTLDTTLSFLTSSTTYPNLKEVTVCIGCSCSGTRCRLGPVFHGLVDHPERAFPSLAVDGQEEVEEDGAAGGRKRLKSLRVWVLSGREFEGSDEEEN